MFVCLAYSFVVAPFWEIDDVMSQQQGSCSGSVGDDVVTRWFGPTNEKAKGMGWLLCFGLRQKFSPTIQTLGWVNLDATFTCSSGQ